jgi:hypothetical protein
MPAYGRTKSGRKHIKPVQFGLDVTGDGGVPVGHLALDGNAGEVNSHLEDLKLLGRTLPKGKLLYIADSKRDAPDNLLAIAARKGQFLCGGALSPQLQERYSLAVPESPTITLVELRSRAESEPQPTAGR